jgi:enamine deaminase RidA (YjgF/YER057c/UK114 family)
MTEQAVHAGDVVAQAEHIYRNISLVLEAADLTPANLVKTIEYVSPDGLAGYRGVADVRRRLLTEPFPASTGAICLGLLRREFLLEIDPMAVVTAS